MLKSTTTRLKNKTYTLIIHPTEQLLLIEKFNNKYKLPDDETNNSIANDKEEHLYGDLFINDQNDTWIDTFITKASQSDLNSINTHVELKWIEWSEFLKNNMMPDYFLNVYAAWQRYSTVNPTCDTPYF